MNRANPSIIKVCLSRCSCSPPPLHVSQIHILFSQHSVTRGTYAERPLYLLDKKKKKSFPPVISVSSRASWASLSSRVAEFFRIYIRCYCLIFQVLTLHQNILHFKQPIGFVMLVLPRALQASQSRRLVEVEYRRYFIIFLGLSILFRPLTHFFSL